MSNESAADAAPAADVQVAPPRDEDAERKPLVYVAGPITGDPFGCVRQAMAAFQMIRHAGCVPFLPQLSVIGEMVEPQDYEAWMAYDFDVIDHCDALYRLRGDSAGADREVDHARSLGLPVLGLDGQDWPALCALTTRTPPPAPAVPVGVCEYIVTGDEGTSYCSLAEQSRLPVEQAGRRELDVTALPEWTAFIAAHDAATAVTTPQPGVQPEGASAARTALIHAAHRLARAASLTRAARALAAAPSPATEPDGEATDA